MSGGDEPTQSQTQASGAPRTTGDDIGRVCANIVDRYRQGSLSRIRAVAEISQALIEASSEAEGESSPATDDALQSYLRMLTDVDSERARGHSPRREPEEGDERAEQPPTRESEEPVEQPERATTSRANRTSPGGDDGLDREREDPSRYAWAGTGLVRAGLLSDNLRATVELLRQYGINIKQAKRDLLLTVGAPEFPSSEWDNILRSFAVDLDRVLEGMYSTSNDEVEVTELGPFRAHSASRPIAMGEPTRPNAIGTDEPTPADRGEAPTVMGQPTLHGAYADGSADVPPLGTPTAHARRARNESISWAGRRLCSPMGMGWPTVCHAVPLWL